MERRKKEEKRRGGKLSLPWRYKEGVIPEEREREVGKQRKGVLPSVSLNYSIDLSNTQPKNMA
jgi:hypothetical protein